ncbi:hypothetical protein OQA88_10277 [Cercophora sp. LCS_1]
MTTCIQRIVLYTIPSLPVDEGRKASGDERNADQEDIDAMLDVIQECIRSLFRIGILVRKSTTRDRFERALRAPNLTFSDFFDINYVREKHAKIRDESISSRIGGAITKRREFMECCRDRRFALGEDDTGLEERTTETTTAATTFVLDSKVEGGGFDPEDDSTSSEDVARRNQEIHQQLKDIHDTILLFMKKIKTLEIAFFDHDDARDGPSEVITHSIERTGAKATYTKETWKLHSNQETKTVVRHYHITDHMATGLAKSQGRTYSESEEASGAYTRGEVVLAFPTNAESVPVLENQ